MMWWTATDRTFLWPGATRSHLHSSVAIDFLPGLEHHRWIHQSMDLFSSRMIIHAHIPRIHQQMKTVGTRMSSAHSCCSCRKERAIKGILRNHRRLLPLTLLISLFLPAIQTSSPWIMAPERAQILRHSVKRQKANLWVHTQPSSNAFLRPVTTKSRHSGHATPEEN